MPVKGSEFIVKFQDITLPKDIETRIARRIQAVVNEEIANAGDAIGKSAKDGLMQFDPKLWKGKWIFSAVNFNQANILKNKLQVESTNVG